MVNFYGTYYDYENGSIVQRKQSADDSIDINAWTKTLYSFISFGTEQWQLQQQRTFHAGYMSVGYDGKYLISPTPHGAYFNKNSIDNLIVNQLTDIKEIALARYQLMTAFSLSNSLINDRNFNEVSIIGSGAVAIGAALEFLRRNYKVKILTKRVKVVADMLVGSDIRVLEMQGNNLDNLIVDCVGTEDSMTFILEFAKANAVVGILGSPRVSFPIDLYLVHKKGLCLVGLHELNNFSSKSRQRLFDELCEWLGASVHISESWFELIDATTFGSSMLAMKTVRPTAPFLILKW